MNRLSKEQQQSLKRKWLQAKQWDNPIPLSYLQFRRSVQVDAWNCAMVKWGSMWLGIEQDGYTHS